VICSGGTLQDSAAVQAAIAEADMLIAADSGAHAALAYQRLPDILVGDLDSLDPTLRTQLQQQAVRIIQAPVEKDETDTELAIQVALAEGATRITLLGAFGGARIEHSLANVFLLASYPHFPLHIVDGPSRCWLLNGPDSTDIVGQEGDLLSLFPLQSNAHGITTTNLYYALESATLTFGKPRGISNVLTANHARVSLQEGMLLLVHTCLDSQI
jgi:thiamine pyrophosphokinase